MTNFNELKLTLVHYFIKVEKYKALEKYSNEYVSYLINPRLQFKIIRLTVGSPVSSDKKLDEIKKTLKTQKREKIEILNISISDTDVEFELEGTTVTVSSLDTIKSKLKTYFSKIDSIKENEKEEEIENVSQEDLIEMLTDPTKITNIKLKKAVMKMNQNSPISIVLLAIFSMMPIITTSLGFWWFRYNIVISSLTIDLIFGATNRNLTINGGQWWRIFTYGFTTYSSGFIFAIFQIFLVLALTIKIARYTEGVVGSWRFALSVFLTYPLTGFFLSVILPRQTDIFSGGFGLLASIVGILGVTTWDKKKDTLQIFSKSKLIWPILWLVVMPFFTGQTQQYYMIIVSAALSSCIYLLTIYKKDTVDKLIAIPITMIVLIVAIPLVLTFLNYYSPAHDVYSIRTLSWYVSNKVLNYSTANKAIHGNGWDWYIQSDGTIISWR